ncbi:hypothetical protein VTN96DRAFT_3683 [Rasamsonia emersonii]
METSIETTPRQSPFHYFLAPNEDVGNKELHKRSAIIERGGILYEVYRTSSIAWGHVDLAAAGAAVEPAVTETNEHAEAPPIQQLLCRLSLYQYLSLHQPKPL